MVEINRKTKETDIKCKIQIDGCGKSSIKTGVGFFDHMLEALSKHSGIDIELSCEGDLHIDAGMSSDAFMSRITPTNKVSKIGMAGDKGKGRHPGRADDNQIPDVHDPGKGIPHTDRTGSGA